MAGFNRVIIMGNLTRDPDHKQLNSGQTVCRLGLAANRQYRNRQTGDMVQEVCFVDVDVWGPQAESCRQYLAKGRAVLVEGRLKLDTWQDAEGNNRSKHSVVADRVVFMPNTGTTSEITESGEDVRLKSQEEVLEHVKNIAAQQTASSGENTFVGASKEAKEVKAKKKKHQDAEVPTGELDIVDAPPFPEDLPF